MDKGGVGSYTSLQLNSTGHAIISYYDSRNESLKCARCTNASCTSPTVITIDTGHVGEWNSLQLNDAHQIIISYYDSSNETLKCAAFVPPTTAPTKAPYPKKSHTDTYIIIAGSLMGGMILLFGSAYYARRKCRKAAPQNFDNVEGQILDSYGALIQ